jgi:hypothetical protein
MQVKAGHCESALNHGGTLPKWWEIAGTAGLAMRDRSTGDDNGDL